jgi:hypothetical protein
MLVVDYLNEKWAQDPKMSDYLRPKTLFARELRRVFRQGQNGQMAPSLDWRKGLNKTRRSSPVIPTWIIQCQRGSVHEQAISEMGWWKVYPAG